MFIFRIICAVNGFLILFHFVLPLETNGFFSVPIFLIWVILDLQICTLFETKMASSQIQINSNPSFDCILRDHNRRDRFGRESRVAFQKNLKDLVLDRLQLCISSPSTKSDSDSNENKNSPLENAESKSNKPHHVRRKSKGSERWNRAREMVITVDNHEGPNHGGVSSLVKKWRDFEAESNNKNSKSPSSCPINETQTEFVDRKLEDSRMNDEKLHEWVSDTTANSGSTHSSSSSSISRDSDGAESEGIKVADIIQKLKIENSGNESIAHIRTASDPIENRGTCQVLYSPRIRGRQALSDLLIQMGRDRLHELENLGERKTVSRFSHKGRIQALLRVKLLRGGSELRDNRFSSPTVSKLNSVARGSTIMHLRARFSTLVDQCASNPTLIDNLPEFENTSTSNQTEDLDKTHEPEKSCTTDPHQFTPSTSRLEDALNTTASPQSELPPMSKRPREKIQCLEDSASKNHPKELMDKTSNFEDSSTSKRPREEICDCEVTTSTSNHGKEDVHRKNSIQVAGPSCEFVPQESKDRELDKKHLEGPQVEELTQDFPNQHVDWEEQEVVNTEIREIDNESRDSYPPREGEEEMMGEGTNDDWINDIARPKSDWEDLRKARYQEMLDPYMEKGDLRVLLQRRSVSTFLSSGLKERIERLMISRTQGLPPPVRSSISEERIDEEDDEYDEEDDEYDEEDEDGYEEEEDDDDDEVGEYFDQQPSLPSLNSTAPTPSRTWGSNRSVDLDQLAMQSPLSNSYSQSSRQNPVEMELIYDLKGQMEQLHQEMFEIHKSVKSCISMQVKLQRSIKQEVVNHSVQREGNNDQYRRAQENGKCCICRTMPVDSLLYRCGHMCTCFKCAHELQWSGGKCPICTAPILDIVRPCAS